MISTTKKMPWNLLQSSNSSSTSLVTRKPTMTQPAWAGVVAVHPAQRPSGGAATLGLWPDTEGPSLAKFMFFAGSPGSGVSTFSWAVIGWTQTQADNEWLPEELCAGTGTIGSSTGATTASTIPSSCSIATGLTITFGNSNIDCKVMSPGNNYPATLTVDLQGNQMFEVQPASSSMTLNCVFKTY